VTDFVLIPGAGGHAGYWSRLVPLLERLGHRPIAVDIRQDDPALGLPEYADVVRAAAAGASTPVVVGQSLGGFTAPMVATDLAASAVVLVNAMIPLPGETPGAWWEASGQTAARAAADAVAGRDGAFDLDTYFLHDLPADVRAELLTGDDRTPSDTPFGQRCTFDAWPHVPLHVVAGRDDRFFPVQFQREQARARLGVEADDIAGGHLVALANPDGLAELLDGYTRAAG